MGFLGCGGPRVGKPGSGQPLQRHWDGRRNQDSPLGGSDQPPGVEGCEENAGPRAFGTRQKQGTHGLEDCLYISPAGAAVVTVAEIWRVPAAPGEAVFLMRPGERLCM